MKNDYDYDSNRTEQNEGRNLYNETGILIDIDSNEDKTNDSKQFKNRNTTEIVKNYNDGGSMDYNDDWVYNKNYTSETVKYADKENMDNNLPSNGTHNENSNYDSVQVEAQSDEIRKKSMKKHKYD